MLKNDGVREPQNSHFCTRQKYWIQGVTIHSCFSELGWHTAVCLDMVYTIYSTWNWSNFYQTLRFLWKSQYLFIFIHIYDVKISVERVFFGLFFYAYCIKMFVWNTRVGKICTLSHLFNYKIDLINKPKLFFAILWSRNTRPNKWYLFKYEFKVFWVIKDCDFNFKIRFSKYSTFDFQFRKTSICWEKYICLF